MMITTKVEEIVELGYKAVSMDEAAKQLSMDYQQVEKIVNVLEEFGVVKVIYSPNPLHPPYYITVKKLPNPKEPSLPKGDIIEEYKIGSAEDFDEAEVKIIFLDKDKEYFYFIDHEPLAPYTELYIKKAVEEISLKLPSQLEVVREEERREMVDKLQKKYAFEFVNVITEDLKLRQLLVGRIKNIMFGLGMITTLLLDDMLEEVVINKATVPIGVFHKKYGWMKTNLHLSDDREVRNYAAKIAREVGRQITTLMPLLDAFLPTGDRVNATLKPISPNGATISIRRFSRRPWTVTQFISSLNTLSAEMVAMLWQAIQYELNMIIAGGTASGKTSMLNALSVFFQPYHRIVSIEDTREINLPDSHWNWVPLVSRLPNTEGLGEVTMLDLMVNSLRMRPDRIIVGEIRRKEEARTLFEAMHTGHSVYSTVHADTGRQLVRRLIEPPIEVPPVELDALHLIVVQYRDRKRNIRRTLEISELETTGERPEVKRIFMWKSRTDTFEKIGTPDKYYQLLNLHTGMTQREVDEDIARKVTVLNYLQKQRVFDLKRLGLVMHLYYTEEDDLLKAAEKNTPLDKVL